MMWRFLKKFYKIYYYWIPIFWSLRIPDSYKKIDRCDVLLCNSDTNRGESLRGHAYDKLIDSIAEDLVSKGWKVCRFAYPFSVLVGDRAWGNPVSANRKIFFGLLRKKFYQIGIKIGLDLDKRKSDAAFYNELFYDELLNKALPKCIISISSMDSLCRLARMRNIRLAIVLHGIGYKNDYTGWYKKSPHDLPACILSFDEVSTNTFLPLASKGVHTFQIPHPWYQRFLIPSLREKLPEEWIRRPGWLPTQKKVILISFQWGYDGEPDCPEFAGILKNGLISDELIRAIEITKDSIFWLLRLHPKQHRKSMRYRHHYKLLDDITHKATNCEWRESSLLPLPTLLCECSGHVTMFSMTAYDAAYMRVPSLLLCPTLKPNGVNATFYEDLRALNFAELGDLNTDTIVSWAQKVQRRDLPFQSTPDSSWESVVKWMLGTFV